MWVLKMNKLRGFVLIEVIISVLLLSIIGLGIYNSIITVQNLEKTYSIKHEMLNEANNIVEGKLSNLNYETSNNYQSIINESSYNHDLKKLEVIVSSKEIKDEVKLIIYYEEKD